MLHFGFNSFSIWNYKMQFIYVYLWIYDVLIVGIILNLINFVTDKQCL